MVISQDSFTTRLQVCNSCTLTHEHDTLSLLIEIFLKKVIHLLIFYLAKSILFIKLESILFIKPKVSWSWTSA